MTRLTWGAAIDRTVEGGVDRGVLYVGSNPGVAWTGLTAVDESPSGGEVRSRFIDGQNYRNYATGEKFAGTISAFYSPAEFDVCDGSVAVAYGLSMRGQKRMPFGLSYRTLIGNPANGFEHGYKIHLVYNALASPSLRNYNSLGSDAELTELSWTFVTKPVGIPTARPSAHLVIDSTEASSAVLSRIEEILYGTNEFAPRLPSATEVYEIFDQYDDTFTVVDNGDGTFTISSEVPGAITMLDSTTFQLTEELEDQIHQLNSTTYTLDSY